MRGEGVGDERWLCRDLPYLLFMSKFPTAGYHRLTTMSRPSTAQYKIWGIECGKFEPELEAKTRTLRTSKGCGARQTMGLRLCRPAGDAEWLEVRESSS